MRKLHRRKREQRWKHERSILWSRLASSDRQSRGGKLARQGPEGAPDAWLEIEPRFADALLGMEVGHELIVITWLHEAKRDVLKGHPRNDPNRPLTGVFTRVHRRGRTHWAYRREIGGTRVKIGPIEAFDGTPVVDIKSASTRADG